jgi:hypothetical protein
VPAAPGVGRVTPERDVRCSFVFHILDLLCLYNECLGWPFDFHCPLKKALGSRPYYRMRRAASNVLHSTAPLQRSGIATYNHVMAKDVIHISEAVSDFASLMARVRSRTEVVIEDNSRPGAVVRPVADPSLRLLSESLGSHASMAQPRRWMGTSGVISKRSSTAIAHRSASPLGTVPRLQRG